MSILPGFTKGQSDNLPKIDSISMFSFLAKNPDFMGAEIRGIKAQTSGHESYGDNAVGYVQVKRELNVCTVKAKVTPEHSLRKKAYDVTLQCNEVDEEIISVSCDDCAASLGGCKHAIATLTWLHRRSEEPPVTSVSCYWKKSKLSTVGKPLKFIKAKDLGKSDIQPLPPSDGSFLNDVLEQSKREGNYDCLLPKYFKVASGVETISLHYLFLNFSQGQHGSTEDDFLNYCSSNMPESLCSNAANETFLQHENVLWYELRYGRITASKVYEAAHCHTLEGFLVESILGAVPLKDSVAMKRGRMLEKSVRREIEKEKNIKIKLCGFKTSAKYPVIGDSPDGLANDYVIEIKCPTTEKAVTRYIKNGEVTNKYYAQIQMQMFFYQKKQGLFCVADADFENSNKLSIISVDFNEQYCLDLLEKCQTFWKLSIFPMMKKSLE